MSVSGRLWPTPNLFVPLTSTVTINCALNGSDPYWAVDLANDGDTSQKQFIDNGGQRVTLNYYGVYQIEPQSGMPQTLRLLINDTASNNGTLVVCAPSQGRSTTLLVFGELNFFISYNSYNALSVYNSYS